MPKYARPAGSNTLEDAINAFGSLVKISIIRHLTQHGPATAGEIATALDLSPPTAKRVLYALVHDGVIDPDPPPSPDRNGQRVSYTANIGEIRTRYRALGKALGL